MNNRTIDYATKNDGKYVNLEDCRKIEKELEWLDEKLANVNLALDKLRYKIIETHQLIEEAKKKEQDTKELYGFLDGILFSINLIDSEKNKILRRR